MHTSSNMTAAERLRRITFGSDPIIPQSSLTIGVRVRCSGGNYSQLEVGRLSGFCWHIPGASPARMMLLILSDCPWQDSCVPGGSAIAHD